MLLKKTFLYLPAQFLPAAFQFAALIFWAHQISPRDIGIVTLFSTTQEVLNIAFIGGWNWFVVRFMSASEGNDAATAPDNETTTAVVLISTIIQAALGFLVLKFFIDNEASIVTCLLASVIVGTRSLNLFQSERSRASGKIPLYTASVMAGPVFGFLLGLAFLQFNPNSYVSIFWGFALAQLTIGLSVFAADPSWLSIGRAKTGALRSALSYSAPLIVSSLVNWLTQNAGRLAVSWVFGLAASGVYALGFGLGYRASMVAALGVTAAAFPIAVNLANRGEHEAAARQLAINGALLFGVVLVSCAGLAVISPDVVTVLLPGHLKGDILPVLLWSIPAGGLICMRQHFINQIFLLRSNTRPIAIVSTIEAIVALLLAVAIVPLWGSVGGAVALTITSALSLLGALWFGLKEGLMVPWRDFAKISVAAGLMAVSLLVAPLQHDLHGLIARIILGGGIFFLGLAITYASTLKKKFKSARHS